MNLVLRRAWDDGRATYGVLILDAPPPEGGPFAVTLEPPWAGNARNVSCIPPGVYECRRVRSPRFGDTFEVQDVPGRSHVLFHGGNYPEHTQGCILVAEEFARGPEGPYVAMSKLPGKGFNEFLARTRAEDVFTLEVMAR